MKILDDLGFEELARMYCYECRSIQELAKRLFEPRHPGETPGRRDIYAWLHKRGHWERWSSEVRPLKGEAYADDSIERIMAATEADVRIAKAQSDHLLRVASRMTPEWSERQRNETEVRVTFGSAWGKALNMLEDAEIIVEPEQPKQIAARVERGPEDVEWPSEALESPVTHEEAEVAPRGRVESPEPLEARLERVAGYDQNCISCGEPIEQTGRGRPRKRCLECSPKWRKDQKKK